MMLMIFLKEKIFLDCINPKKEEKIKNFEYQFIILQN